MAAGGLSARPWDEKRDQHTRQVNRLRGLHGRHWNVGTWRDQELAWGEAWGRAAPRASVWILSQENCALYP